MRSCAPRTLRCGRLRGEQLDQSGSNDFSAFKEIQELKEGSCMLRWVKAC